MDRVLATQAYFGCLHGAQECDDCDDLACPATLRIAPALPLAAQNVLVLRKVLHNPHFRPACRPKNCCRYSAEGFVHLVVVDSGFGTGSQKHSYVLHVSYVGFFAPGMTWNHSEEELEEEPWNKTE